MLAYHNDPQIKADILAQLERHRAADELVKGQYWKDGKGCAVACTIHSDDHAEYEVRFGIPQMLARFEDRIFEGLSDDLSQEWPIRFMSSIEPGQDLSLVGWRFLHRLLIDSVLNPGITDNNVVDVVRACADVTEPLTRGGNIDQAAAESTKNAAIACASEGLRAAESAGSAENTAGIATAFAAANVAKAVARAANAASAAKVADIAAARAAESAAWQGAAESARARRAAYRAAYARQADLLIELIKTT